MAKIKGRVRKFEDNIDTDVIAPAAVLQLPIEEIKQHAFAPITKEFYKTVKEGDIIVAGENFGCGSSREQATEVVKELGIHYVVCDSIARIYFRNCIALGMYPIISKGASKIFNEGDEIEVDTNGTVKNLKTGNECTFEFLSGTAQQILDAGGILPLLKRMVDEG
ncbi:3-isopropylmalate dehydratase small subunit [Chloroflexota bacterium]